MDPRIKNAAIRAFNLMREELIREFGPECGSQLIVAAAELTSLTIKDRNDVSAQIDGFPALLEQAVEENLTLSSLH